MKTELLAIADRSLTFVEVVDGKPTRLIDVSAHIATNYADVTVGELHTFAMAYSATRSKRRKARYVELEGELCRRPSHVEAMADAKLNSFGPHINSGHIKRFGKSETRLTECNLGNASDPGRYQEQLLRALYEKTKDETIGLLFRRE